MRERDARDILLVKSIEESDREGSLLPLADRATATREALRERAQPLETTAPGAITPATLAVLAARARRLLDPLQLHHPFLRGLLRAIDGSPWIAAALLLAAALTGIGLSSLGGGTHVDVLALPLLGLVIWNLAVYAALIARALWPRPRAGSGGVASAYAWSVGQQVRRLLKGAARFDARLGAALQVFAGEWLRVERPRLVAKGERLLHLAAVAVALGLVEGLYFRGVLRGWRAGWDSTWPELVPTLLQGLYGVASKLTGIALPTGEQLAAMRWSAGPGVEAAPWIHLIAVTALVFIVAPRLLLAAVATWRVHRSGIESALWASLGPYARGVMGAGQVSGGAVRVASYGYTPSAESESVLHRLLPTALGADTRVIIDPPAAYGAEDEALARIGAALAAQPASLAVLMSLASTPEDENHGALLTGVRDLLARSPSALPWLLLVDQGPYAERMAGAPARIDERRRLWAGFAQARGLQATFVDLRDGPAAPESLAALRAGLMAPRGQASW